MSRRLTSPSGRTRGHCGSTAARIASLSNTKMITLDFLVPRPSVSVRHACCARMVKLVGRKAAVDGNGSPGHRARHDGGMSSNRSSSNGAACRTVNDFTTNCPPNRMPFTSALGLKWPSPLFGFFCSSLCLCFFLISSAAAMGGRWLIWWRSGKRSNFHDGPNSSSWRASAHLCLLSLVLVLLLPTTSHRRRPLAMGSVSSLSFLDLLPASLFIFSLVLVLALGLAALLLEHVRRISCEHSLERTSSSDVFFEDPNSLQKVPCPSIFDQAEKYISLIIPAFNEEHRLAGAFVETINYLQKRASSDKSFSYEVLIVDDGSTDRTSKVAFSFVRKYKIENVRVILLGKNHGKGEAIRKGMLHSRGELLLMLDADGATKINDLEKLESQIRALTDKIKELTPSNQSLRLSEMEVAAFGSRAHLEKQALATRKWYRNFLMKGFHLVVLLTAGPGIRDTQCGFKMFTRAAGRRLFTNMRLKRWCFDVELVYLCKHIGIPMIEVSVNWSEIPGSKVRLTSILHMLFELMLIRLGYGLGIWKIYT